MRLKALAVVCVLGMSASGLAQAPAPTQPGVAASEIPTWAVWPSNLPNPAPLWIRLEPAAEVVEAGQARAVSPDARVKRTPGACNC